MGVLRYSGCSFPKIYLIASDEEDKKPGLSPAGISAAMPGY
jgi:hypothetical protein